MGNPLIIAIGAAAVLTFGVGFADTEKKQPAPIAAKQPPPYIKPDPATALRKFDFNLFKVKKWAHERGAEPSAAANYYNDLVGSIGWYRFLLRRELALQLGQPTQETKPIILLDIEADDETPTKEGGVNRVIIDLEPAETEVARAITKAAEIEPDPQYKSPVFYCLNDYNQCIRSETRWVCMPLIAFCMAQNVIPLTSANP